MRYCGYDFWGEEEEERRELEREEGGEGREGGGRGSRHGRRSWYTLSPPNPAPPYILAEIGQQVGSVLLLKTQPGHRYLLSLNTSQVRTAWSAPLLFHSTSNTNQSPSPPCRSSAFKDFSCFKDSSEEMIGAKVTSGKWILGDETRSGRCWGRRWTSARLWWTRQSG